MQRKMEYLEWKNSVVPDGVIACRRSQRVLTDARRIRKRAGEGEREREREKGKGRERIGSRLACEGFRNGARVGHVPETLAA